MGNFQIQRGKYSIQSSKDMKLRRTHTFFSLVLFLCYNFDKKKTNWLLSLKYTAITFYQKKKFCLPFTLLLKKWTTFGAKPILLIRRSSSFQSKIDSEFIACVSKFDASAYLITKDQNITLFSFCMKMLIAFAFNTHKKQQINIL